MDWRCIYLKIQVDGNQATFYLWQYVTLVITVTHQETEQASTKPLTVSSWLRTGNGTHFPSLNIPLNNTAMGPQLTVKCSVVLCPHRKESIRRAREGQSRGNFK